MRATLRHRVAAPTRAAACRAPTRSSRPEDRRRRSRSPRGTGADVRCRRPRLASRSAGAVAGPALIRGGDLDDVPGRGLSGRGATRPDGSMIAPRVGGARWLSASTRSPPRSSDTASTRPPSRCSRALIRTAFSPIIYDVLDFAVAIYDRDKRLLSQAPGLPNFLGTMGFCVEGAVSAVGEDGLRAGRCDPVQLSVRHRVAPGGHGGRSPGVPRRRRAGRVHGDQGALSRHRGEGLLLHRHASTTSRKARCFPASSCTTAASCARTSCGWSRANSRVPSAVVGDLHAEVAGATTGAVALRRDRRAARAGDVSRRRG